MADYAEIVIESGRVLQVKHGGAEPRWPARRRGVVLNPANPNHVLDLTRRGHYTAEGQVFTFHPAPPE